MSKCGHAFCTHRTALHWTSNLPTGSPIFRCTPAPSGTYLDVLACQMFDGVRRLLSLLWRSVGFALNRQCVCVVSLCKFTWNCAYLIWSHCGSISCTGRQRETHELQPRLLVLRVNSSAVSICSTVCVCVLYTAYEVHSLGVFNNFILQFQLK